MNKSLTIILSVFILNIGCAQTSTKNQDSKFIDFINSFDEEKSDEVLIFSKIIQQTKPMAKKEALSFVYKTEDTTALYCIETSISQETEKVMAIFTSLYLPDKYFRIEKEKYFLICYSSYKCKYRYNLTTKFLHFLIIDKNYNITDKLIVCDYDWDESFVVGLLNPNRNKIFLKETKKNRAIIYAINGNTLTFNVKKESNEIPHSYDLLKVIKELGWKEYFFE
jgi:hypothetical protein